MITCIIIDDERSAIERLEKILAIFPEIRILATEQIPEFAVETTVRNRPDIVFLDIEMSGMSGFEFVDAVRSRNCHPTFIFVTGHDHYAIKAIKDSVFDYLIKPVDIDDLKQAIERFKQKSSGISAPRDQKSQGTAVPALSDREKEVLKLLMQGKTSKQIAKELIISKTTVDTHRRNILEKTGAQNTSELISLSLEKGLI